MNVLNRKASLQFDRQWTIQNLAQVIRRGNAMFMCLVTVSIVTCPGLILWIEYHI